MAALIPGIDLLVKLAPMIIPPRILMFDGKFPNLVEVFACIAKNPPEPTSELAMKYLYLCRLTGVIWLVWALNFSLFIALGFAVIFAWADVPALQEHPAKLIQAAGFAMLFMGAIVTIALLRVAIELRDGCIRLCTEKPKRTKRTRRGEGDDPTPKTSPP